MDNTTANEPKANDDGSAARIKRYKRWGSILLVVGAVLAFGAAVQDADRGAFEMAVGYGVPLVCFLLGAYLFFKGGGKVA